MAGCTLTMVAGYTSTVVKRVLRRVLPGQLAPHPACWNVLVEQDVRCGRVDHQGALEFSPLGAVAREQELIVAGEHCLAVRCEDGLAVAEQQQWHHVQSPSDLQRRLRREQHSVDIWFRQDADDPGVPHDRDHAV